MNSCLAAADWPQVEVISASIRAGELAARTEPQSTPTSFMKHPGRSARWRLSLTLPNDSAQLKVSDPQLGGEGPPVIEQTTFLVAPFWSME